MCSHLMMSIHTFKEEIVKLQKVNKDLKRLLYFSTEKIQSLSQENRSLLSRNCFLEQQTAELKQERQLHLIESKDFKNLTVSASETAQQLSEMELKVEQITADYSSLENTLEITKHNLNSCLMEKDISLKKLQDDKTLLEEKAAVFEQGFRRDAEIKRDLYRRVQQLKRLLEEKEVILQEIDRKEKNTTFANICLQNEVTSYERKLKDAEAYVAELMKRNQLFQAQVPVPICCERDTLGSV
eukprot:GCRY01002295.1.p1 GENE.GCRY01002295.1~~GCRY01002295.1.p1  ORF type:complete len:241 (-),score=22.19 GCRY01002295.1:82-804(-)